MPGVDVLYRHRSMNRHVAQAIKETVREVGHKRFSTPDLQLEPEDFSIKFLQSHPFDELTHDIIVRIRMQDDPFRRSQSPDRMAGQLANRIHLAVMASHEPAEPPLTVGVELMLVEMGWNTSSGPVPQGCTSQHLD
jgi:hypothetical protein